jgi:hypothetical protein
MPGAERAFVSPEKVRSYLLDPDHPRDRNKARVFAASLDLRLADAPMLIGSAKRRIRSGGSHACRSVRAAVRHPRR